MWGEKMKKRRAVQRSKTPKRRIRTRVKDGKG
jgi:hypothetical protein